MSSPRTSIATLGRARMLLIERLRVSTARVTVCGSRATAQVISVVSGDPSSETVATTSACPPRRNCTRCGGISTGAFSAIGFGSRAGGDARTAQAGPEDGTGLVALGAVELRGDEREDGGGLRRARRERPG